MRSASTPEASRVPRKPSLTTATRSARRISATSAAETSEAEERPPSIPDRRAPAPIRSWMMTPKGTSTARNRGADGEVGQRGADRDDGIGLYRQVWARPLTRNDPS